MNLARALKPARHIPLTTEQLYDRARLRRDHKREVAKALLASGQEASSLLVFDNRAPHANRPTRERLHRRRDDAARREAFHRALRKEAAIGINPVYRGVCDRGSAMHKQWLATAKEWDRLNPVAA